MLASGRGAKIITSLEEVLLIELAFVHGHNFQRAQQDVLEKLQRAQLEPLAYEVQADQQYLRLAYTAEIASGSLAFLQDLGIEAEIKLKEGYSMVGAVGAGVTKNAQHSYGFFQQLKTAPVEFVCEAESGLSLVAVLRQTAVEPLVTGLHTHCSRHKNGSRWLCAGKATSAPAG